MKIIPVKQGTTEWLTARAGIFTASELDNLITPTWKARTGETRANYILRKVAERCVGYALDQSVGSWAVDQGVILEQEAIPWMEFTHDVKVDRVGFVTSDCGRIGCSPDGLIGEDGGIEIKCPQPPAHVKYLLSGGVPSDYLAQVHGSLYVTGRRWWKFLSYSRALPPVLVHVERDEEIMAKIDAVMQEALAEFDEKLTRLRALKAEHDGPKITAHELKHAAELEKVRAANGGKLPGEEWLKQRGPA